MIYAYLYCCLSVDVFHGLGMSVSVVNAKADVLRAAAALAANCNAAKGLQDVLKSNLGPKGTVKMLVGGEISDFLCLSVCLSLFLSVSLSLFY